MDANREYRLGMGSDQTYQLEMGPGQEYQSRAAVTDWGDMAALGPSPLPGSPFYGNTVERFHKDLGGIEPFEEQLSAGAVPLGLRRTLDPVTLNDVIALGPVLSGFTGDHDNPNSYAALDTYPYNPNNPLYATTSMIPDIPRTVFTEATSISGRTHQSPYATSDCARSRTGEPFLSLNPSYSHSDAFGPVSDIGYQPLLSPAGQSQTSFPESPAPLSPAGSARFSFPFGPSTATTSDVRGYHGPNLLIGPSHLNEGGAFSYDSASINGVASTDEYRDPLSLQSASTATAHMGSWTTPAIIVSSSGQIGQIGRDGTSAGRPNASRSPAHSFLAQPSQDLPPLFHLQGGNQHLPVIGSVMQQGAPSSGPYKLPVRPGTSEAPVSFQRRRRGPRGPTPPHKNEKVHKRASVFKAKPRGKRTQRLSDEARANVNRNRENRNTCMHCKINKTKCLRPSPEEPCEGCKKVAAGNKWSTFCHPFDFSDLIKHGSICPTYALQDLNGGEISLPAVVDIPGLCSILRYCQNVSIRFGDTSADVFRIDIDKSLQYLEGLADRASKYLVSEASSLTRFNLQSFLDSEKVEETGGGVKWQDCIHSPNGGENDLPCDLVKWMSELRVNSFDFCHPRNVQASDCRQALAALYRILKRRVELHGFDALQKAFQSISNEGCPIKAQRLPGQITNLLLALRRQYWSLERYQSRNDLEPVRLCLRRLRGMCEAVYFHYFCIWKKAPLELDRPSEGLNRITKKYKKASVSTEVSDGNGLPLQVSQQGFEAWLAANPHGLGVDRRRPEVDDPWNIPWEHL